MDRASGLVPELSPGAETDFTATCGGRELSPCRGESLRKFFGLEDCHSNKKKASARLHFFLAFPFLPTTMGSQYCLNVFHYLHSLGIISTESFENGKAFYGPRAAAEEQSVIMEV